MGTCFELNESDTFQSEYVNHFCCHGGRNHKRQKIREVARLICLSQLHMSVVQFKKRFFVFGSELKLDKKKFP